MQDLSGQLIKGYELRERLGAGGFGAVYRAYQAAVAREVAIKIILPDLASQPDFIRRFETEAQVVAHLEHPCIVPLYDYWRDPDGAYLVMRWLRGGSLADLLKHGALEIEAIERILEQITSALTLAHRSNIIHRDIKPGNILLDEDGNAYLADFGIAKDLRQPDSNVTEMDAIVGSLDYISPEQARSEPVTSRTDIYSLGVVLYEMLTGEHPFPNISAIERLYKHINDPLPDITLLEEAVRDGINEVVQQATAKDPAQRYESVAQFAAAFKDAVGLNRGSTAARVIELLTRREQEVLSLLVGGASNKVIAAKLVVTVPTVKWYVNEIFRKLHVRSRVQAILRARELNLIVPAGNTSSEVTAPSIVLDSLPEPENPYKGLRAFQAADEGDFFGREEFIQRLLRRFITPTSLTKSVDHGRFLAVVGPSGSGKSSVVKAGLIPALLRGEVSGSERWFMVEMLPGARPFDELEIALTRIAPGQLQLHDSLIRDEHGLLRVSSLILPQDNSELVIIIDQFEEVFTLVEDEMVRAAFLKLLLATASDPRSRVRLVVTLRADFYDRPLHYPEFGELLRNHMETILPLSAKNIERAIAEPARRAGVTLEEGLIATIVTDVNYQAGALPLLQYALTELFEQRRGRTLTHAVYQAIGGAVGALARRAEAIYQEFTPAAQALTRQMFLRLVTPGEGIEDTRRRTTRAELAALSPDADILDEVVDTYANYRLLALDHDPSSRAPTVEVAHEALLREWERLRGWINESRSEILFQQQVAFDAAEWAASQYDESYLLTGSRLIQAEERMQALTLSLTPGEQAYLQSSLTRRNRETSAEINRQANLRRINRWLQVAIGVLGFVLLMVIGLAFTTSSQFNRAETALVAEQSARATSDANFVRADAARLASSAGILLPGNLTNAEKAALLAIQSLKNTYSSEAENTLLQATQLLYTQWRLTTTMAIDAAFSPDGKSVYIADYNKVLEYDTGSGVFKRMLPFPGEIVFKISPSANRVLTIAVDMNQAVAYDLETGQEISRVLYPDDWYVYNTPDGSSVSPDGQEAFLINLQDELFQWNLAENTLQRFFAAGSNRIFGVQYTPDSRFLLAGRLNTVAVIDRETMSEVHTLSGHTGTIAALAVSADGHLLATGSESGEVIIWETDGYTEIGRLSDFDTPVNQLAFTPDGQRLGVITYNGHAYLWDLARNEKLREFTEQSQAYQLHFAPDGSQVIVAAATDVRILNARPEIQHQTLQVWDEAAGIVMAPDEQSFIYGGTTLARYDIRTGAALWEAETGAIANTLDVSPDGHYLVTGGSTWYDGPVGAVEVRDAATGHFEKELAADGSCVKFSPDGAYLVVGDSEGSLRLLKSGSFEVVWTAASAHTDRIGTCVFAPDGATLYTGGERDAVVRRWNVRTGESAGELNSVVAGIVDLAVAPDGSQIVIVPKTDQLYFADGELHQITQTIELTGTLEWVRFSEDGKTLTAVNGFGAVSRWDVKSYSRLETLNPDGDTVFQSSVGTNVVIAADIYGGVHLTYLDYRQQIEATCQQLFNDLSYGDRLTYHIADEAPVCDKFNPNIGNYPRLVEVEDSQPYPDPQGRFATIIPGNWRTWRSVPNYPGIEMQFTTREASAGEAPEFYMNQPHSSYIPGGTVQYGGRDWTLHRWQVANSPTGQIDTAVGMTTVGSLTYIVQITGQPEDVDYAYDTALLPALSNFRLLTEVEFLEMITPTPAPTALPTSVALEPDANGILYTDDFSFDQAGWETDAGTEGFFSNLKEGKYVIDIRDNTLWYIVAGATTPDKAPILTLPYTMQFDLDQLSSDEVELAISLIFNGSSDYSHFLNLVIHENGKATLLQNYTPLTEVTGKPFHLKRDGVNRVQFQVGNAVYRVLINEEQIVELPAVEPVNGTVGFGIGNPDQPGNYHGEVDNLVITVQDE